MRYRKICPKTATPPKPKRPEKGVCPATPSEHKDEKIDADGRVSCPHCRQNFFPRGKRTGIQSCPNCEGNINVMTAREYEEKLLRPTAQQLRDLPEARVTSSGLAICPYGVCGKGHGVLKPGVHRCRTADRDFLVPEDTRVARALAPATDADAPKSRPILPAYVDSEGYGFCPHRGCEGSGTEQRFGTVGETNCVHCGRRIAVRLFAR